MSGYRHPLYFARMRPYALRPHSMVSEGRKPAWMLALWGWDIVLYRHFYRRKTIAFTGSGDGLGLRGGYSSSSIVNDHQQPSFYCARVERAGGKTLQARSGRQSDSATRPRSYSGHRARRLVFARRTHVDRKLQSWLMLRS